MDQTIRLDAKKRESAFYEENIYPLRRGERNNVVLTVQVRADGAPYDLTGKEARLVGTTADGKLVGPCALDVSDAKAGTGSLTLPASMCSAVGTAHAYIEIREGDTLVETTDSFACKVLECADMDAEQAAARERMRVTEGAVIWGLSDTYFDDLKRDENSNWIFNTSDLEVIYPAPSDKKIPDGNDIVYAGGHIFFSLVESNSTRCVFEHY